MSQAPRAASRPPVSRRPATAADRESRRRRVLTWVLSAGVAVLLTNAIIGENGSLATLGLERTEAALQNALATLRVENQRLKDARARLDADPDTLEQTIREQLGYIHPGEVAVIVRDTPLLPDAPAP